MRWLEEEIVHKWAWEGQSVVKGWEIAKAYCGGQSHLLKGFELSWWLVWSKKPSRLQKVCGIAKATGTGSQLWPHYWRLLIGRGGKKKKHEKEKKWEIKY